MLSRLDLVLGVASIGSLLWGDCGKVVELGSVASDVVFEKLQD